MAVSSMTGFARAEGAASGFGWTWEVRSVNSRSLDIRLRVPSGFDRIEAEARAAVGARFTRGSVSGTLNLDRSGRKAMLSVNREALDQVIALSKEVASKIEAKTPRIDGLLAIRGVVETVEPEETDEERAALDGAILASLDQALGGLADARAEEGNKLATVVSNHIEEIAGLAARAREVAAAQPAAIEARLLEQVRALAAEEPRLSDDRLAQEVALLAVKADVREELDRLVAHVASARELMSVAEPVGRRLDFLCQEFNREANTLCSKSSDIELTRIGLDLKAAIDRLREQIQNIE